MNLGYLNPADQFVLMYDHVLKEQGFSGNYCGLVLGLEGEVDVARLSERIASFRTHFPQCTARISQKKRQFFWQSGELENLFIHKTCSSDRPFEDFFQQQLTEYFNAPPALPVQFLLLSAEGGQHRFALRWYHPLTDARGAENLLRVLLSEMDLSQAADQEGQAKDAVLAYQQSLSLWQSLKQVKQVFSRIKEARTIQNAVALQLSSVKLCHRVLRFQPGETRQIQANAIKHLGLTGISLYFLACIMRALAQMSALLSYRGNGYVIPYAFNLRKANALYPLFHNQISFLFASAPDQVVADRQQLFAHLSKENKQVIGAQKDKAFIPLMRLAQQLPLPTYAKKVRFRVREEESSSCWFSYTGKSALADLAVFGAKIADYYQVSPVTQAPGLAILVSQWQQSLSFSLNYFADLENSWLTEFCRLFRQELLEE